MKRAGWERVSDGIGGHEYRHVSGARVYNLTDCLRHTWGGREWGVQMPSDTYGDGGFSSMREAMGYVERHTKEAA